GAEVSKDDRTQVASEDQSTSYSQYGLNERLGVSSKSTFSINDSDDYARAVAGKENDCLRFYNYVSSSEVCNQGSERNYSSSCLSANGLARSQFGTFKCLSQKDRAYQNKTQHPKMEKQCEYSYRNTYIPWILRDCNEKRNVKAYHQHRSSLMGWLARLCSASKYQVQASGTSIASEIPSLIQNNCEASDIPDENIVSAPVPNPTTQEEIPLTSHNSSIDAQLTPAPLPSPLSSPPSPHRGAFLTGCSGRGKKVGVLANS
ncbi:unnamed protein product, partial [Protopolystoma xenopodis]